MPRHRWRRDDVKAAGTAYLPRPEGMYPFDGSYVAYVTRALFYNAMSRTIDGLAGSIFQRSPVVAVSRFVEPSLADITLADESFDSLALRVERESFVPIVDVDPEDDEEAA